MMQPAEDGVGVGLCLIVFVLVETGLGWGLTMALAVVINQAGSCTVKLWQPSAPGSRWQHHITAV